MGIEPTLAAWEAAVLPLNYTRAGLRVYACAGALGNAARLWLTCAAADTRLASAEGSFGPERLHADLRRAGPGATQNAPPRVTNTLALLAPC